MACEYTRDDDDDDDDGDDGNKIELDSLPGLGCSSVSVCLLGACENLESDQHRGKKKRLDYALGALGSHLEAF